MSGLKDLIVKGVVTVVIGGTVYTVNQTDIIDNFARDTGMTQQQAEQYVNGISEDELVTYDELGDYYIDDGRWIVSEADKINCQEYTYDWESTTLSCETGKAQYRKIGNDEILLGESYEIIGSDEASDNDVTKTIERIDILNDDFDLEMIVNVLAPADLEDMKNTNSYNKATLKAAMDSN